MPIHLPIKTRRISQKAFGDLAFTVMRHAFEIHNEFGRFCNESIYQRELAIRVGNIDREVPVTVTHASFAKTFYLDLFVSDGGLFELKCVDRIHPKHRAQVTQYLLMTNLAHAKLINFRPLQVEHEFVNCEAKLQDLKCPRFDYVRWERRNPELNRLEEVMRTLVSDWGLGLESDLYSEAISNEIGMVAEVEIKGSNGTLGSQTFRLINDQTAFKITALRSHEDDYRRHAMRLLRHTPLNAIAWINFTRSSCSFELLEER